MIPSDKEYEDLVEYMRSKLACRIKITYTKSFIEALGYGSINDVVLFYNFDDGQRENYGAWELSSLLFTENWFNKPLEPTTFELELFKLEFGHDYPLLEHLK